MEALMPTITQLIGGLVGGGVLTAIIGAVRARSRPDAKERRPERAARA